MPSIPVENIMTKDVVSAEPDRGLLATVAEMERRCISCVVVCEEGSPVGVLSERDVVRVLSRDRGALERLRVADVMSSPAITVRSDASVPLAIAEVGAHRIRRLPVVDADARLVGIVTQTDLVRAHAREIEEQRDQLEREVRVRTRELREANERLARLSLMDPLLGVGNRRAMEMALDRVFETARRYGRPFAVVLVDVDHFKAYNDHYGHPAGDAALQDLCERVAGSLRRADSVYRYGGEELLVLLPETELADGARAAERLRSAVEDAGLRHRRAPGRRLTVSCGVAATDPSHPLPGTWRELLRRADGALYEAKSAGRNRVAVAEGPSGQGP